jgi:hypothetical protein
MPAMQAGSRRHGCASGGLLALGAFGRFAVDCPRLNLDRQSRHRQQPQASQEIGAGNAALARFNAANGGVLNGTIQSLLSETREMRYRRDVHGWPGEISPVPATSKSWRK